MQSRTITKLAYLFAIPALLVYLIFWIIPTAMTFFYSMTNWTGLGKSYEFIGLKNLEYLLRDGTLLNSLKVTLLYCAFTLVVGNIYALVVALILNMELRLRNVYRVVFYLPSLLSTVVVGYIWGYVYIPHYGMIAQFLKLIGLSTFDPNLLGNTHTALYAVSIVEIWKASGGTIIIYLAGLQTIPYEIEEAARIDGCSRWQLFWRIRFPLLSTAITINLVLSVIFGLKAFDYMYLMTKGGPGKATSTLMFTVYNMAFVENLFGKASALGIISFLVILVATAFTLKFLRSREVEIG
jgi:raffinose/stachyose/melibiose transport system permease protein